MFFSEKIIYVNNHDKVLEIGTGATPHKRSDIFLELSFDTIEDRIAQSGHVGVLETEKPVFFYDGGKFPFRDQEFDYVICSHVLEHVPNVEFFISELQRVAPKGYLEFPTLYYDYLYNFPEHINLINFSNGVIKWMTKEESGLFKHKLINDFFYRSCELGYHSIIQDLKNYFFQGFEWFRHIKCEHVDNPDFLAYDTGTISKMPILETKKRSMKFYESFFNNFLKK